MYSELDISVDFFLTNISFGIYLKFNYVNSTNNFPANILQFLLLRKEFTIALISSIDWLTLSLL